MVGRNATRIVLDYLRTARRDPQVALGQVDRLTLTEAGLYVVVLTEWLLTELGGRFDTWARRLEDEGHI